MSSERGQHPTALFADRSFAAARTALLPLVVGLPNRLACEQGFPRATLDELRLRGHDLVAVDDYNQFGSCQAIWRLDGGYLAASDPRRDGQAAGC